MSTTEIFAGIGIFFIIILLIIIFLIPNEKEREKKNKNKKPVPNPDEQKDWKATAAKLEKHIQSLRQDIDDFEKKEKVKDRQLAVEQAKIKALQDKLAQERSWQEREGQVNTKQARETQQLKEELTKLQEQLAKGHADSLRFEREGKDLKLEYDKLNDQRRGVQLEAASLKARVESLTAQIRELKSENAELKKKKEDETWIAKSEYEKLQGQLKDKETELAKIRSARSA